MSAKSSTCERGISRPCLRRLARRTKNNSALATFLLLDELAGDDRVVRTTRDSISQVTGVSLTAVSAALKTLTTACLIEDAHEGGSRFGLTLRLLDVPERAERRMAVPLSV